MTLNDANEGFMKTLMNSIKNAGILLALIGLGVFLSIVSDVFLTVSNITNIFRQVSSNLILSIGTALVILTGGIDVSIGSIMAFSSAVAASLMVKVGCILASVVGLLVGAALGALNGIAVGLLGLEPFVVTLSSMAAVRAMTFIYTKGYPISTVPEEYNVLGSGYLGPFPIPTLLSLGLFVVVFLVLRYTPFGRHIYATGDNEIAAIHSGINVKAVKIAVYTLNGLFAAFAGLILVARLNSAIPTIGSDAPFDAIAAVVMGGISLSGGRGSLLGALVGVLLLGTINNGLNLLRIHAFWQGFVRGVVIFIAIVIDRFRATSRGK